jgi:hypothetical protein
MQNAGQMTPAWLDKKRCFDRPAPYWLKPSAYFFVTQGSTLYQLADFAIRSSQR